MVVKPTYEELVQSVERLEKEALEHKKVEMALWQKTHDLGERVKELNCLYGIADLVEQLDISLEEILQGTVDLIPPSWQYPEITCARIIIQNREWKTKNFRETIWKQTSDIKTYGELSGNLEVYYLEENPEIDEGPSLREKRNLINAIAMLTGRIVERKQGEEILRENEKKYRTFLETTSEGCWLINPGLKTVEVNDTLCKMLGYSQNEMLGRTPFDFVDDENRKIFIEQTSKISSTAHRSYEITLKKKNGEDLPTYFNATTLKDESGEVQGSFAFITDVTTRKRAEDALRESEEKYHNIFENIQDVYYEVTLDGIVLELSPSIEKVSCYKREEVIGKSLYDIYVDPKNRDELVPKLLKNGNVVDYEILLKDKDASQSYCSITAKLLNDKHGKPVKIIGSMHNISGRKRVEQALRRSESQKRVILDASDDSLRYVDKDMKIIWANKATTMKLEMAPEDVVGQTCYKLFVGRDTPCEGCATVKARETGKNERTVIYQSKANGIEGESYWDCRCIPLKNHAGEIESFVQVARNITEQKQAMAALEEGKDTLQAILTASPIGIALVYNRTFDWVNKAMHTLLGYEEGSLLGKTTRILYRDKKEYDRSGRELYLGLDENGIGRIETRWVKKGGDYVYCYLQASPLELSDPDKGIILAAMDISERKHAEALVRDLSQKLIQAQERERQMISYELHDRIAQDLSWLKIGCDTLFDGQSAISSEAKSKLAKLSNTIEHTITAVRDLSYDLRPPGLDEMGLVRALEIYCEDFFKNTGVAVEFQSAGIHKLNLDTDAEIHLYRLIQEGLNNIHKHADADQTNIKLVGAYPNVILRIEDDGSGFDVRARKLALNDEKRMGLRSMQERVNLLQGQMTIQSRPGKGTKIVIKIPVKEQNNESQKAHINH